MKNGPRLLGRSRNAAMVLLVALTLLAAAGCGAGSTRAPQIRVEGAWARPAANSVSGGTHGGGRGGVSAAYFTIFNDGGTPDTLTGVSTDAAAEVSLHKSVHQSGVAKMLPIERLVVPAGGRVALQPGGNHVMMMGVTRALEPGADVRLALHFRTSGTVYVDARVGAGAPR